MKKLSESIITERAVKYAGAYVDARFKNGSPSEKNLVLNTLAHGFYMGSAYADKIRRSWWRRLFPVEQSSAWAEKHGLKAAKVYLRKKGYLKLDWTEQALIRATVAKGFEAGVLSLE